MWVKILCLLARCVRAGMPVNAQTLRPLCIAAVSIAVKENFDEGMSANDVRRALPHLTLWHLGYIELDLLQLIGWRATIWEATEWTAYVAGLRTVLSENAAELRGFAQRYGVVINTIVETPLISPRPPPPRRVSERSPTRAPQFPRHLRVFPQFLCDCVPYYILNL